MKIIRDAFGITQDELASYFEITRSQLSLTETGGRTLPVNGMKKCIVLLKIMKTEPVPTVEASENEQQAHKKTVARRLKDCNWQLMLAQKKLADMQMGYRQCCLSLLAVNTLLPLLTQEAVNGVDKIWLELLERKAKRKLSTCNIYAQKLQQLEIDKLHFEIAKLGEMMGEE